MIGGDGDKGTQSIKGCFVMKGFVWETISEICSSGNSFWPKRDRNPRLNDESSSNSKKGAVFPLSHPILLWCVGTSCLV